MNTSDTAENIQRRTTWAGGTVTKAFAAKLNHPVFTGKIVLNLLDFTEASRSPALAQHLQIAFDKTDGREEISATFSEAVAESFNHKDPLARGDPVSTLRSWRGPASFLRGTLGYWSE